jgi:hypothetical protein
LPQVHAGASLPRHGACETIACVVSDREHRTGNGRLPDRLADPARPAPVVRFAESIGTRTTPFR